MPRLRAHRCPKCGKEQSWIDVGRRTYDEINAGLTARQKERQERLSGRNMPTRGEIMVMSGTQLDTFLDEHLIELFIEHGMGNRHRNVSVNSSDAQDVKVILRKLGYKFFAGEFEDGWAVTFEHEISRWTPFWVVNQPTEELAIARAAVLTLVEKERGR